MSDIPPKDDGFPERPEPAAPAWDAPSPPPPAAEASPPPGQPWGAPPPPLPPTAGWNAPFPPVGPPAGPPPGPPWGAPSPFGPGGYRVVPSNDGGAVAVLVLGIASIFIFFMCALGIIPAIVALAMAPGARRRVEASNGQIKGLEMIRGGVICSWVTVGLTTLAIAATVMFFVVAVLMESS